MGFNDEKDKMDDFEPIEDITMIKDNINSISEKRQIPVSLKVSSQVSENSYSASTMDDLSKDSFSISIPSA